MNFGASVTVLDANGKYVYSATAERARWLVDVEGIALVTVRRKSKQADGKRLKMVFQIQLKANRNGMERCRTRTGRRYTREERIEGKSVISHKNIFSEDAHFFRRAVLDNVVRLSA